MRKASILATLCVLLIALPACQQGPGTKPETEKEETPTYSSRIFTVRPSDFAIQGVPGGIATFAGIEYSMPEITKEAIEQGIVQAHVEPLSSGVWLALPFSVALTVSGLDISLFLSYAFSVGKAALTVTGNVTASEMAVLLGAYDGYRFRVVVGQP